MGHQVAAMTIYAFAAMQRDILGTNCRLVHKSGGKNAASNALFPEILLRALDFQSARFLQMAMSIRQREIFSFITNKDYK
jgi:hypothetical protein